MEPLLQVDVEQADDSSLVVPLLENVSKNL